MPSRVFTKRAVLSTGVYATAAGSTLNGMPDTPRLMTRENPAWEQINREKDELRARTAKALSPQERLERAMKLSADAVEIYNAARRAGYGPPA
jgi:hypothetical protein